MYEILSNYSLLNLLSPINNNKGASYLSPEFTKTEVPKSKAYTNKECIK